MLVGADGADRAARAGVEESRFEEAWRLLGPSRLAYHTPIRLTSPLADRKAIALLAAAATATTVLLFFAEPVRALVRGPVIAVAICTSVLAGALLVALGFGAWISFRALVLPLPRHPDSLAYYGEVSRHPYADYHREMLALRHARAFRMMLEYNHAISSQCSAKFRLLERAMACIRAAYFLWMLLMLWLAATGGLQ